MRLSDSTWNEVEDYLSRSTGIIIPAGSTEQHGPVGPIGTDAICADAVASAAAEIADALTAPPLVYSPAQFNLAFAGSVSVPAELFESLALCVIDSLAGQGFRHFYFLNGHGANLAPLGRAAARRRRLFVRIRSWWDFAEVNSLRRDLYGDWEGMHATPSEIAITRSIGRIVESEGADTPPRRLSREYIKAHADDRHGPPEEHRRDFPDGRVGSHSALARPEHGQALLNAAAAEAAKDYLGFAGPRGRD